MPNAGWLSPYQVSSFSTNNWCPGVDCHDCESYQFERCFCVPETGEVRLRFDVMHDDFFYIDLVGLGGLITTIYEACEDPIGGQYFQVPRTIDTTLILEKGKYCLEANLFNVGGVAMGFALEGNIEGVALETDSCCANVGTISGTVFNDLDCDGILDLNNNNLLDPPLSGWQVALCELDGTPVTTTFTDVNGAYTFTNITPGNYLLKEDVQSGWIPSSPVNGQTNITVSATGLVQVNFGNCEQDSCCIDQELFLDAVNQGFFVPVPAELQIDVYPLGLEECTMVLWSWGDGTPNDTSLGNAIQSHTYATTGEYQVCMTAYEHDANNMYCWEGTICDTIKIMPSGLKALDPKAIEITPNPTIDFLNFDLKKYNDVNWNIEIVDLSGKIVIRDQFTRNSKIKSIDVAKLPATLYLIRLKNEVGEFLLKKFIKL